MKKANESDFFFEITNMNSEKLFVKI